MTEPELIRSLETLTRETRTLRDSVQGLVRSVQKLAERAEQSETAIARSRWNIRVVAAIAILGLAVGGVVFAARSEGQQRQITRNAARLAQVVYTQCVTQDTSNARQIAEIDPEIAKERRKPHPDQRRIDSLIRFRPDRLNCGTKP